LLLTSYHERFYQPYLGANLQQLLFEPVSDDVLGQIKHQILNCIAKFEPRAKVLDLQLTVSQDEHTIYSTLVFATMNTTTPTTLSFILNRVR
jgi:phage baseplate assembly protein W